MAPSASGVPSRKATQRAILQLREVMDRLAAAQAAVAVAVAALRAQNADVDADVARLLARAVSDPLREQILAIKSVSRMLAPATRKKR